MRLFGLSLGRFLSWCARPQSTEARVAVGLPSGRSECSTVSHPPVVTQMKTLRHTERMPLEVLRQRLRVQSCSGGAWQRQGRFRCGVCG